MLFLHQLTFSTKIIICRKTNIFIFNALANKDTCRTSNRGVYMYYVEKFFFWICFWAFPFRSGYSGVPPSLSSTLQARSSLAMLQNGADSVAPLLSLTHGNACQPYCRDTCPRHGTCRQSGIPAAYPTAALRSAVG